MPGDGDINTIWTMEYEKAQAGMKRMGDTIKDMNNEIKKVGESSAVTFKQLENWDRTMGKIARAGAGLLSVFGVSGGLAAGVSFIVSEMKRAQQVQLKVGEGQAQSGNRLATVAGFGGPGAVKMVARLSKEMNVPEDVISKKYVDLRRNSDIQNPAAIESQIRRSITEESGGKGFEQRQKEAAPVAPQIPFSSLVNKLKEQGDQWMLRPETPSAARNIATAQGQKLYQQAKDMVAQKYHGVPTWADTGWRVNQGSEAGHILEMINKIRAEQGLGPAPAYTDMAIAHGGKGGPGGQFVFTEDEINSLAKTLLDATNALNNAANNLDESTRTPR